jgi:hypothetical protein
VRAGLGTPPGARRGRTAVHLESHYWLPSRAAWINLWTNRQWLPKTGKARAAAVDLVPSRPRADLLLSCAEMVATPILQAKVVQGFVPYGERQQAYSVLSDLEDPVLSSAPPRVVGLFGGRYVASPCWARR